VSPPNFLVNGEPLISTIHSPKKAILNREDADIAAPKIEIIDFRKGPTVKQGLN
jgi:hypothetical protein